MPARAGSNRKVAIKIPHSAVVPAACSYDMTADLGWCREVTAGTPSVSGWLCCDTPVS